MGSNQHDQALMEILKEEKSVVSFLDSVFGFLYRCTDFYHTQTETSQKIGFPPGVANEVTLRMFQRYEKQARYEEQAAILKNVASTDDSIPPACQEVELCTTSSGESNLLQSVNPPVTLKEKQLTNVGDHYNGDDRGDYRWSQSIRDIDLLVNVPKEIQKAKQLRVKIDPHHLKIENLSNGEWSSLIDHSFPHKISVTDSVWSLLPGELIQVNLEKKEERWWDRLFTTDPPIDVKAIDTAVPASDLSQEEHMKIEELMVGQEARKRNNPAGLEHTLKAAWNAEGSPFQGQPVDMGGIEYISP